MRRLSLILSALVMLAPPLGREAFSQSGNPREVQQALADRGFAVGTVDGLWGRRSIAALKAFQKSAGLPATGVVDEATLEALTVRDNSAPTESPPVFSGAAPKVDRAWLPPPQSAPIKTVSTARETPTDTQPRPRSADVKQANETTPSVQSDLSSTSMSDEIVPTSLQETRDVPVSGNTKSTSMFGKLAFWGGVLFLIIAWRRGRAKRMADQKAIQSDISPVVDISSSSYPKSAPVKNGTAATAQTDNDTLVEIIAPQSRVYDSGMTIQRPVSPPARDKLVNAWEVQVPKDVKSGSQRTNPDARGNSAWVAADTPVVVGPFKIAKGLIYVGSSLLKQGGWSDQENCLIDPRQKVAKSGDPTGETMGYWPSYSQLTPSARYSYLEWLAGDRSDPNTYIGYIFLYFYGLERRLMLEPTAPGNGAVASEVRRLHEIYGDNGPFNRYASELLSAYELQSGEHSATLISGLEQNGYEVPTAIKIAIGVRVRDQRPIEPELLLRFVTTHPETRLRTPAKRAPEILETLFIAAAEERYPNGYVMKPGRTKALKKRYRACSGTFEVDVDILGGAIPDVTDRAEPINTVRRIFDRCTDALDEFSRALGRQPGMRPSLSVISKLPLSLRRSEAEKLEGSPLAALDEMAKQQKLATVELISEITGISLAGTPTKSKLREISQLCASFNLGVTFDPAFAFKVAVANDQAILFSLTSDKLAEATPRFRELQLSLMLSMLVGHADGHFHESERNAILGRIQQAVGLTEDDRLRLIAEVRLNEANPERLEDWMKRLKDVPSEAREAIVSELIVTATADGELHADEIRKLETIFRRMGMPVNDLYDRLHGFNPASKDSRNATASTKPNQGNKKQTIDLSRLQSIRSETLVTSSVLADIFNEEEDDVPAVSEEIPDDVPTSSELFDGLEQRYGLLLSELISRSSWSSADFEHLVRDAGLMPGAAREAINEWALDRFDDLLLEGDDPVDVNVHLLPSTPAKQSDDVMESLPA